MKVSFLRFWINESYALGYFEKCLASLEKTAETFGLFETVEAENRVPSPSPISAKKEKRASSFTFNFKAKKQEEVYEQRERITNQTRIKFKNELRTFKETLETHGLVYKHSTRFFWNENALKLPMLHKLAQIILNINSSSASIERFFSLCGFVCDPRRARMDDDLVIIRCLLKANIQLISQLKNEASD